VRQKLVLIFTALASGAFSIAPALAQAQQEILSPTATTSENGTPTSPDTADLAITSTVTARELRFREVPNSKIEFSGSPERNTGWRTQRVNLPKPVQSGVTYRDIGIRLQITSEFTEIDRIVREALGEAPAAPQQSPSTPGEGGQQ
jgi:hypothetical protein